MNMLVLAVIALPLLAAITVLAVREPLRFLLPLYVVTVPYGSLLSTGLPAPLDSVSTPLLILLVLSAGAQLVAGVRTRAPMSPTVAVWVLLLGWASLTGEWSISAQVSSNGILNLTALVLLFVVLSFVRVDRPVLRNTQWAIVASGALAGLYGLAQVSFLGGLPLSGGVVPRFGSDMLGPNNTAAALMLPLALSLHQAMTHSKAAVRHVAAASAGLIGIAVVLSGSRGGLLATLVVFVVLLVMTRENRGRLLSIGATGLVALVLVVMLQPSGVGTRQVDDSSSGRSDIWRIALEACESYCLSGSGWGTFPRVYQDTQPLVPESRVLVRGVAYEAHNIWLEVVITTGIVGLTLLVLALFLTWRDIRRTSFSLRAPPMAAFWGTMTASMFLSNFEYKFFWLVLTYAALCRSAGYDQEPSDDAPQLEGIGTPTVMTTRGLSAREEGHQRGN